MKHIKADDGRILTPPSELEPLLKDAFPAFYELLGHMRWFYMVDESWDGNSSLVFNADGRRLAALILGDSYFDIEIANESFRVESKTELDDIFDALKNARLLISAALTSSLQSTRTDAPAVGGVIYALEVKSATQRTSPQAKTSVI